MYILSYVYRSNQSVMRKQQIHVAAEAKIHMNINQTSIRIQNTQENEHASVSRNHEFGITIDNNCACISEVQGGRRESLHTHTCSKQKELRS